MGRELGPRFRVIAGALKGLDLVNDLQITSLDLSSPAADRCMGLGVLYVGRGSER
jgi:hypothetical protein